MNKILEALSGLLPKDKVNELTAAVSEMTDEMKKEMDAEYNTKLEEAYGELTQQLEEAEKTAEQGYQEAHGIIQDLRNRLETQRVEFEKALEEGYEEAYQMLQGVKSENGNIEHDLYEEFENRLKEMKGYMVDKIDEYLEAKTTELREQVRREVMNDPRMMEQKIALEHIVETCAGYLTDQEHTLATGARLQERVKKVEELQGQVKLLEARHIRVSTENNRLNEQLRQAGEMITESRAATTKRGQKERIDETKKVQGRGEQVIGENVKVIGEHQGNVRTKTKKSADMSLVKDMTVEQLHEAQKLAGVLVDED
jgi:hypothetical protein